MSDRFLQVGVVRGLKLSSSCMVQHERAEKLFEPLNGIAEAARISGNIELSCLNFRLPRPD
jgi:hypothetical protein